jgi:hypothetical protein
MFNKDKKKSNHACLHEAIKTIFWYDPTTKFVYEVGGAHKRVRKSHEEDPN